ERGTDLQCRADTLQRGILIGAAEARDCQRVRIDFEHRPARLAGWALAAFGGRVTAGGQQFALAAPANVVGRNVHDHALLAERRRGAIELHDLARADGGNVEIAFVGRYVDAVGAGQFGAFYGGDAAARMPFEY